jgi:hypothetical protein
VEYISQLGADPKIVLTWLGFGLGVLFLWIVVVSFSRGSVANMDWLGGQYDRETSPSMYWFLVVLYLAFCLAGFWVFGVGIGLIPEPSS